MKKYYLLFLIFFSSSLMAQTWPKQMYTIEKLFSEQFSSLRTYIKNLKVNYPYKVFKNKIVFYTNSGRYNEEIFTLYVKRQITQNKIKEEIIFSTPKRSLETFIFERQGKGLHPTDIMNLTSFEFNYPHDCDQYSIEFERQKIYQRVEITENRIDSNYRLFDYGLEIHHIEKMNSQYLYSKLWYQCDVCSGDPLVVVIDRKSYHDISYYHGSPLEFLTPQAFYARANRSYLSGIYREFGSIPAIGIDQFYWPKED